MGRPEFNNYTFYKFSCLTDNVECCYVGSTANFLARQRKHKYDYNNANSSNYKAKIYETIRANGGWENWKMVAIGELKNITLIEARMKEEEYRVNLKADLNTYKAYTSKEEKKQQAKKWRCENKEHIAERTKIYDEKNKEKKNEQRRLKRKMNKISLEN